MKITIESTDRRTELNGLPCRLWNGVTEGGAPVMLAIAMIRIAANADRKELRKFDEELAELPQPVTDPFALKPFPESVTR